MGVVYYVATFLAMLVLYVTNRRWKTYRRSAGLPYPPGPPPDPLIGNVRHMPKAKDRSWFTFTEWGKKYGPLTYLDLAGQPVLVVNTRDAISELMDKKIYSDRLHSVMMSELMGVDWFTALLGYTPRYKQHRKMLDRALGARLVQENFAPSRDRWMKVLLKRLLDRPHMFQEDIRHCIASIVVEFAYGRVSDGGVDFTALGHENALIFMEVIDGFMVDFIPALKYLPDWFPGADFKRKAKRWRQTLDAGRDLPFAMVKRLRAAGEAEPSFCSSLLDLHEESGGTAEDEIIIKEVVGTLFGAGSDTSQSVLQVFFLAMVLFPDVQKRAQEEIDRVIGTERLPTLQDRESLPYMTCVLLETIRWHITGPIGVPRRLMEDDFYRGYFIPKGTLVIGNFWGMATDPSVYPDPKEFKPERFEADKLASGKVHDPRPLSFGFGRRACPGIHVAQSTVWIGMAMLLSVFEFRKKVDPLTGLEITPQANFNPGIVSIPLPFECDIRPRSESAANLIRQAVF